MNWIPSAKAVSSRVNELVENENQIVEAETGLLKQKKKMLKRLLNAQQERNKLRIEFMDLHKRR